MRKEGFIVQLRRVWTAMLVTQHAERTFNLFDCCRRLAAEPWAWSPTS